MDIFMDKLAQKLTAQEMIKANAAADAAEMNRLKSQVSGYEALLEEMRTISRRNTETAERVNKLAADCADKLAAEYADKLDNADKVTLLIDESITKIKEMQQDGQALSVMEQKLEELKTAFENLQTEITDYVHKENVKVYRNVQAVLVEEMAKQKQDIGNTVKSGTGKINAVFGISLVTLFVSVVGIVFQLLTYLKII